METKPYVKASIRLVKAWNRAAKKIGTRAAILRKVYLDSHYGIVPGQFFSLVTDPKKNPKYRGMVLEEVAQCKMTPEQCDEAERKYKEQLAEHTDFTDLLNYRLKQLIRVGDEIVSCEDKTFTLSPRKQYQTAGKRYKILSLDDRLEWSPYEFSAITTADLKGERIYWCVYGIRSLWRGGKEIWNWWRDYHTVWAEQNPGHPETAKMERQRDIRADEEARGVKTDKRRP